MNFCIASWVATMILVGVAAYAYLSHSMVDGYRDGENKQPLDYVVKYNTVDVFIQFPNTMRRNDTARVSWHRPVCSRSSEMDRIVCAKISTNISHVTSLATG